MVYTKSTGRKSKSTNYESCEETGMFSDSESWVKVLINCKHTTRQRYGKIIFLPDFVDRVDDEQGMDRNIQNFPEGIMYTFSSHLSVRRSFVVHRNAQE